MSTKSLHILGLWLWLGVLLIYPYSYKTEEEHFGGTWHRLTDHTLVVGTEVGGKKQRRDSAMVEQSVSVTPRQVRRHKDGLLLIIDDNKLQSLDVWRGKHTVDVNTNVFMNVWACACRGKRQRNKRTCSRDKRKQRSDGEEEGGEDRAMAAVPGKETLEGVYKIKLLLNVSH